MLRQKSGIFLLLTALLCLGCHEGFAATIGKYVPCMLRPVFVQPGISQRMVEQPDIKRPYFLNKLKSGSLIERPEIIEPKFVQATVIQPLWDGCPAGWSGYLETIGNFRGGFNIPFSAVASPCCGGSVASPALDNKVARPWTAAPNN